MFITVLFTIAKTWKQPKCPLNDEWIKKKWYIYTMEYYSAIKKTNKCHLQSHGWNYFILGEISQKEKYKYRMISLIPGI